MEITQEKLFERNARLNYFQKLPWVFFDVSASKLVPNTPFMHKGYSYFPLEERLLVGKKDDGLMVTDPSISYEHCLIERKGGIAYIQDLGSERGTFLGKVRLAPGRRYILEDGDTVRLGEINFRFQWPLKHKEILQLKVDKVSSNVTPPALPLEEYPIEKPAKRERKRKWSSHNEVGKFERFKKWMRGFFTPKVKEEGHWEEVGEEIPEYPFAPWYLRASAVMIDAALSYAVVSHSDFNWMSDWSVFVSCFFILQIVTVLVLGETPGQKIVGLKLFTTAFGRFSCALLIPVSCVFDLFSFFTKKTLKEYLSKSVISYSNFKFSLIRALVFVPLIMAPSYLVPIWREIPDTNGLIIKRSPPLLSVKETGLKYNSKYFNLAFWGQEDQFWLFPDFEIVKKAGKRKIKRRLVGYDQKRKLFNFLENKKVSPVRRYLRRFQRAYWPNRIKKISSKEAIKVALGLGRLQAPSYLLKYWQLGPFLQLRKDLIGHLPKEGPLKGSFVKMSNKHFLELARKRPLGIGHLEEHQSYLFSLNAGPLIKINSENTARGMSGSRHFKNWFFSHVKWSSSMEKSFFPPFTVLDKLLSRSLLEEERWNLERNYLEFLVSRGEVAVEYDHKSLLVFLDKHISRIQDVVTLIFEGDRNKMRWHFLRDLKILQKSLKSKDFTFFQRPAVGTE